MAKTAARPCLIIGNWKMYKTIEQALEFIDKIAPVAEKSPAKVMLAVPFTAIKSGAEKAKGTNIIIGAQNMNDATEGAFTGEVAASMLKEAGAEFVLIGHSERRTIFHETNAQVARKVQRALASELQPIMCIGETYDEHEQNKTEEVLKIQVTEGLAGTTNAAAASLVIAYEPVWAIGTGLAATPELVAKSHQVIRSILSGIWSDKEAAKVPIVYGGSVTPKNAESFLDLADVDGLLIGTASLHPETFAKIIELRQNVITTAKS